MHETGREPSTEATKFQEALVFAAESIPTKIETGGCRSPADYPENFRCRCGGGARCEMSAAAKSLTLLLCRAFGK